MLELGMIYNEIAKNIRKYRELEKMSQDDLAKKVGYTSRSAIHLIELGEMKVRIDILEKIAKELKVDLDQLLGREREEVNPKNMLIGALRAQNLDKDDIKEIENFIGYIKSKSTSEGE